MATVNLAGGSARVMAKTPANQMKKKSTGEKLPFLLPVQITFMILEISFPLFSLSLSLRTESVTFPWALWPSVDWSIGLVGKFSGL